MPVIREVMPMGRKAQAQMFKVLYGQAAMK
jgi:hypothetical protein